jgi:hypothetical protein
VDKLTTSFATIITQVNNEKPVSKSKVNMMDFWMLMTAKIFKKF